MRQGRREQAIVNAIETLEADVSKLVDEATPDLLPMLLKIFIKDDRPGLVTCERHTKLLFHYIRAQINLTRARRNYYNHWEGCDLDAAVTSHYHNALVRRDEIRIIYRSTPCTCWVKHR